MTTVMETALMCAIIYSENPRDRMDPKNRRWGIEGRFKLRNSAFAFYRSDMTGFEGGIFECGDDWIVAFRGTKPTDRLDILADVQIGLRVLPDQFHHAIAFFNNAKREKPGGGQLYITGHSLGGGLAQLVAAATGHTAITYNPPGMKAIVKKLSSSTYGRYGFHSANIVNVVLQDDPVSDVGTLIGKKLRLPNPARSFRWLPSPGKAHKQDAVISAIALSEYRGLTPDALYKAVR